MREWSLVSWQNPAFSYEQAAHYPDESQLTEVVNRLSLRPPLVKCEEIETLKQGIAQAGRQEAFILQGGDCAESFQDCRPDIISNKLNILLQMSLILWDGLQRPIIRVGRIAGQYTKPRSSNDETKDGLTLPSYRGDLVNSSSFNAAARTPNPQRMLQGYDCAAKTLDCIQKLHKADFYTSHEALHLYYEQALTRSCQGLWYNLSTHLPWIGMRTAKPNSAHIEFLRGVHNPIGIKISTHTPKEWLTEMITVLNPNREEGRLLLITRLGANEIHRHLPALIQATQRTQCPVTWSCDPMHGNTEITPDGIKTRQFDNILYELQQAVSIHRAMNSYLGGVHFELTGDHVTECIGGAQGLKHNDLKRAYRSLVDPRLNYEQSLEMAMQLSQQY